MAGETGSAGVGVSADFVMVVINLGLIAMLMAIDATEDAIVAGGVAFRTGIPFVFMFSTVNWKIHTVVIESCRFPGNLRVALCAVSRELCICVIGICRAIVIRQMTSYTCGWCVAKALCMAEVTVGGNFVVSVLQRVHGVMVKG